MRGPLSESDCSSSKFVMYGPAHEVSVLIAYENYHANVSGKA